MVLLELLNAQGLLPKFDSSVDVFVLIENEQLRPQSLKLIQALRAGPTQEDRSALSVTNRTPA